MKNQKNRRRLALAFVAGVLVGMAGMVRPYLKAARDGDEAYTMLVRHTLHEGCTGPHHRHGHHYGHGAHHFR